MVEIIDYHCVQMRGKTEIGNKYQLPLIEELETVEDKKGSQINRTNSKEHWSVTVQILEI